MFWMSCKVASISSCSNLFFSFSATRSSGNNVGEIQYKHTFCKYQKVKFQNGSTYCLCKWRKGNSVANLSKWHKTWYFYLPVKIIMQQVYLHSWITKYHCIYCFWRILSTYKRNSNLMVINNITKKKILHRQNKLI